MKNSSSAVPYDFINDIDQLHTALSSGVPELRVGILLWPEFPLMALAGLVDALRHAADNGDDSYKKRCSWHIMGDCGTDVIVSSSGVSVNTDVCYLDPEQFDYIVVIGGLLRSLHKGSSQARRYINTAWHAGKKLVGICTGSFVLAEEGLLAGQQAAVHPYHLEDFCRRFPDVRAVTGCNYVDSKSIMTCPGGISTISAAVELIRRHCGPDRATKAIHQMAVPNRLEQNTVSISQALGFTRVSDPRLRKAVFLVEEYLVKSISTEWLSEQVNLSSRQLCRLFKSEFNQTPTEFIRHCRLKYGKWLLRNSGESITEIALRTGFSDCAHFSRTFHNEYGYTPGQCRLGTS
ncbi:GlxA family transcriptional regulator [Enterobacter cloacae complex sp. 2024EL-00215]|uniref:GlxA family transcriptional regulator n=1 Tax=unclassified Enterobacter cloacae complex TaxID=2757714 RepID=UPI00375309C8